MRQTAKFDYFYGTQAEAYSFYRIPKVLFTSAYFKKLSCEAKVLYGLMLDRMSLSIKNRWFDEEGKVYIIFSIDDVKEYMGCHQQKAVKLMQELDQEKGIGLIEKKRIGFGKANTIYVKNFILQDEPELPTDKSLNKSDVIQDCEIGETDTDLDVTGSEDERNSLEKNSETEDDFHKYENQISRSMKSEFQEVRKSNFKKYENQTSRSMKSEHQGVRKSNCNYTDTSNTENSETEFNPSIPGREMDAEEMDIRDAYEELIRENIGFDVLCSEYGQDRAAEILNLMVDTVCSGKKKIIVGGEPISADIVKNRLLKLDLFHIQYVFECLDKNTTKVRNIRQYMLATLFNAPSTMNHYYSAEINHDMYGNDG